MGAAGCAAGSGDDPFDTPTDPAGSGGSTSNETTGTGTGAHSGTSTTGGGSTGSTNKPDASTAHDSSLTAPTTFNLADASPTPPSATSKFPFPQNRISSACTYPFRALNTDVTAAYAVWKSKFVTTTGAQGDLRVQRVESGNDTVSEGIGYGMIIAVYMDQQMEFDQLWKYALRFMDGNGLMNWHIRADGSGPAESGSATDADEDMAWAMIMADKQWGGKGSLPDSYLNYAKSLIQKMSQHDIDQGRGGMVKPGDQWMEDKTNPSYFAPAYYKVFAKVSGDTTWNKVADQTYNIINQALTHGNAANGLVPDWCTSNGSPEGNYQYDACRTPFRIALDACLFNDARAKSYLAKTSTFFSGVGAKNIKDGYTLTGTATGMGLNTAFLGPASVGAMSSATYQAFLDEGYVRTNVLARAETHYFSGAWGMFSMLMMTANFLDYTQY
jgi:endo-1,4-beta-D-glucanase Y